jgi:hypothetical protein
MNVDIQLRTWQYIPEDSELCVQLLVFLRIPHQAADYTTPILAYMKSYFHPTLPLLLYEILLAIFALHSKAE